jgi:diaminopimelate epimerase
MRLCKYCALGNDYWILNPQNCPEMSPKELQSLCDRHWGLGGDGVLYGPKQRENTSEFFVDIYNADGTLAEISGNGLTIFARYLVDHHYIKFNESFEIIPSRYCRVKATCISRNDQIVSEIVLGKGYVDAVLDYPVAQEFQQNFYLPPVLKLYKVHMGNPHCVVPVEKVSRALAETLGPVLENHPAFPQKANVQFVTYDLETAHAHIEILERGSGYTLGSGSSSCAVACALSFLKNETKTSFNLTMPGGTLTIHNNNHTFSFSNTACKVAEIEFL